MSDDVTEKKVDHDRNGSSDRVGVHERHAAPEQQHGQYREMYGDADQPTSANMINFPLDSNQAVYERLEVFTLVWDDYGPVAIREPRRGITSTPKSARGGACAWQR